MSFHVYQGLYFGNSGGTIHGSNIKPAQFELSVRSQGRVILGVQKFHRRAISQDPSHENTISEF